MTGENPANVDKLKKQLAKLTKLVGRAERMAAGGDPDRGGGQNKKSLEEHVRDGTHQKYRHGPKPLAMGEIEPKPEHLTPSRRRMAKRWLRTPMDHWCADNGYWFDERFAKHFRDFGRQYLKLWEGSQWYGKPFELMRWQYDKVFAPLFGWFYWDEEYDKPCRRFNLAYIQVAKKNGKSPMAAYVGCYMAMADGEHGSKIFSAATTREQAAIVHNHAVQMVRASPTLLERCKIHGNTKSILFQPLNTIYRALASENGTNEGLNGHGCIADELHVWKGRRQWDELRYMGASNPDPLFFVITTAGDDPGSVCYQQYEYAKAVRDGAVHDPGFFGYICEADKDDDPAKESTWRKANPSLGVTVKKRELRQMYNEAKGNEAALAAFKRYRLNIWIKAATPWLPMDHWRQCQDDYTEADLYGQRCYGGLDLSKTRDTTAFTLTFPDEGLYWQLAWFWLPEETIAKVGHLVPYAQWARAGWLNVCPHGYIDYPMIEKKILWAHETFRLEGIHYDPYRAAALMQRLDEVHGVPSVEMKQRIDHFAEPMEEYERGIFAHTIRHNGNPLLTWQAENIQVKTDANNNKRPIKPPQEDVRKIDGIVAAVMGLKLAMTDDDVSQYDDEGEVGELQTVGGWPQ